MSRAKKLPYFNVLRVYSIVPGSAPEAMQETGRTPERGFFRLAGGKVELPKRRRLEKFLVRYTTVHEVLL